MKKNETLAHEVIHSMGIPVHLTLVGTPDIDAKKIGDRILRVFNHYDSIFSRFREDSELMRVNYNSGSWIEVSQEMLDVIKRSVELSKGTGGLFDISVGGYLAEFGYGLPENHKVPKSHPTYIDIEFDEGDRRVKIAEGQVLEPAGIVKAMAIDESAELLNGETSISGWMLNAGGDISTNGKYINGEDWKIGIQNPVNREETIFTIRLFNQSIATSGTYEVRGDGWTHEIKMPSGEPVNNISSISVIAPTMLEADTYSGVAILMDVSSAVGYLEKFDVPYLIVDDNQTAHYNALFDRIRI